MEVLRPDFHSRHVGLLFEAGLGSCSPVCADPTHLNCCQDFIIRKKASLFKELEIRGIPHLGLGGIFVVFLSCFFFIEES